MHISTNSEPLAKKSMAQLTLPNRLQILALGFIATVGGVFAGGDPKEDTPTNPEARSTNSLTMPKRPGADWRKCSIDGHEAVVGTVEINGKDQHFAVFGSTVSIKFCKENNAQVGKRNLALAYLNVVDIAHLPKNELTVKFETDNGAIAAFTSNGAGHTKESPNALFEESAGRVIYLLPKEHTQPITQNGL